MECELAAVGGSIVGVGPADAGPAPTEAPTRSSSGGRLKCKGGDRSIAQGPPPARSTRLSRALGKQSHLAAIIRLREHLPNSFLQHRMHHTRRNLRQRHQHKSPLRHPRMRDFETSLADDFGTVKQYVQVNDARELAGDRNCAFASQRTLDFE